VDFFVVTKCGQSFLIEFKTDSGSRREGQDEYLRAAREVGLAEVLSGILRLYEKTTYKKKYSHLLTKLKHANLMMGSEFDFTPNVQSDELRILYIQPHKKEDDAGLEILDFEAVADALKAEFEEDEFMEAAAETFRGWAFD
jgi:hypothetical protein